MRDADKCKCECETKCVSRVIVNLVINKDEQDNETDIKDSIKEIFSKKFQVSIKSIRQFGGKKTISRKLRKHKKSIRRYPQFGGNQTVNYKFIIKYIEEDKKNSIIQQLSNLEEMKKFINEEFSSHNINSELTDIQINDTFGGSFSKRKNHKTKKFMISNKRKFTKKV